MSAGEACMKCGSGQVCNKVVKFKTKLKVWASLTWNYELLVKVNHTTDTFWIVENDQVSNNRKLSSSQNFMRVLDRAN